MKLVLPQHSQVSQNAIMTGAMIDISGLKVTHHYPMHDYDFYPVCDKVKLKMAALTPKHSGNVTLFLSLNTENAVNVM